jgi:tetratricopeptide (TPR) repeat protein
MKQTVAILASLLSLTLAAPGASAQPGGAGASVAAKIMQRGEADPQNPALLVGLLAELDAETAAHPKVALNHRVRGWVLSHLGRREDAVAAYDAAVELDPKQVDALYECGVVLSDLGRFDEAIARWDAAAKVDPRNIDAFYNAAQTHYNRRQYKQALERWRKAQALDPGDFDVAKKILQALNGLGDKRRAAKAREALIAMWRGSDDERVRGLTEFCFDRKDVGEVHVYAYETFEPKGDLYYVYTFRLTGPDDQLVGAVQLESSAITRAAGTPFVIGFNRDDTHHTTDRAYKQLPTREALWPEVEKVIRAEFADAVR